jgi:hypothetical protein
MTMMRLSLSKNKKSTWFLMLAFLFAILLAMKVNAAMNEVKQEEEVVQTTKYIAPYTVITSDMVTTATVPKKSVVDGTFPGKDLSTVVGKRTLIGILPKTNVQKGHIIASENANLTSLLVALKNNSLVSASVPLSANDIGAQISPGDTIHLDGIFTLRDNQVISKYVAQYVPVLGVDKKEDGTARVYVAVKKEDFPDIARSIDAGRIRAVIAQKEYEKEDTQVTPAPMQQQAGPQATPSSSSSETTKGGK